MQKWYLGYVHVLHGETGTFDVGFYGRRYMQRGAVGPPPNIEPKNIHKPEAPEA